MLNYYALNNTVNDTIRHLVQYHAGEKITSELKTAHNIFNSSKFRLERMAGFLVYSNGEKSETAEKLRGDLQTAHNNLLTALHSAFNYLFQTAKTNLPDCPPL